MQQPMPQPVQQPPALPPGTLLAGRYLIQGYIGGGGFGHIYKAHDKVLGHRRAIKEAFYRDVQTQRQFRLEAEFILNARHPNLVRGYAVFEQGGRFYLVMDYVDGLTVEEIAIQHIRSTGKPLPEAQVLDWVLPICEAAHALHAQPTPIIHRDVKPANIKITRQGIPVLIDLGLAKLYSQGTQTLGAALAFTPGYAPPEQYQATGSTDQRTDVYGLGATLFYLLTGYQPTEAPARLGPHALPPPRALNPLISPLTEAAVLRAMTLDPRGRQQSARELALELAAARGALGTLGTLGAAGEATQVSRMLACTRCGTANPKAARFCMRCGGALHAEQAEAVEAGGVRLVQVERQPVAVAGAGRDGGDGGGEANGTGDAGTRHVGAAVAAPVVAVAERAGGAAGAVGTAVAGGEVRADAPEAAGDGALDVPLAQPDSGSRYSMSVALARDPGEATTVIATVLAAVCVALSFGALLAGWMLVFAVPALGLALWSWQREHEEMPAELRLIAPSVLLLGALWPAMWLAIFAAGSWKWLALVWLVVAGAWPAVRLAYGAWPRLSR